MLAGHTLLDLGRLPLLLATLVGVLAGDLVLYGPSPVNERGDVQGTATYAEGGRWSVSFRGEDAELTARTLDTIEVRRWDALTRLVDPRYLDRSDLNDP